jgi:hypothetical protein
MSTHFSVIGVDGREEFDAFVKGSFDAGIRDQYDDPAEKPSLKLMSGDAGAWIHTSNGCFVPIFESGNEIRVRTVEWMDDPDGCPYCANLAVEVLKPDGSMNYPLAITFGNVLKAKADLPLGEVLCLPVVGFVEKIERWNSLEDLLASQDASNPIKFQPGWFFPLGPYAALEEHRDSNPRAGIYASVESIHEQVNEVTGRTFRVVYARCGTAVYPLLLDETQCPDLSATEVVYVECWMCAEN